jgi:hypothetical protein
MLDGAIVVPVMQMLYSVLYELAAVLWGLQRALLLTGYVVMAITDWLVSQAFTPLLSSLGAQTEIFLGPIFTIALLVLAGTYLLGVFLRIRMVEFKSAVVWLLVALLLFQGGPQLYQGVEEARRGIAGAFYQEGLDLLSEGGGALAALDQVGSGAEADIPAPSNQFGTFLPSDQYVDGLDVAMSYLGADGHDVVAPPYSPHPIERLPWSYLASGGYFDLAASGSFFGDMSREEREASIARGVQGIARLFMGGFISIFGVLEQIIHLALALAMGLAFASAFVAILFAFFKHTEVLVWSVLNLVIELFIQSVLMSLFLSLIISFVLVGAVTGSAVVTLGSVLVGLVLVVILLLAALKAIWNGINRLFGAMSQVTGGTLMAPGSVAAGAAGMATGAALGAVGGAMVLATGSSLTQAAGIALGNNPTLSRAAYMTSMLPGLRETRIGQIAGEFTEGAIARSALGPVVGGAIIPPRRLEAHREQAADPAEAVTAYYHPRSEKDREARLERTFGAAAPQMARVMDAHSEDELLEIVAAVKAVRQSNPTLPAGSPAFQSAVMQRLPEDVQRQFSPEDLRLVVTATGASATERERLAQRAEPEPSPSERAVRDYYQNPDRAAGYAGLQTTFGPAAAPEMARVLDAHSEDDMAEVAAAFRSLQTTQPQIAPNSDEFLRALKTQLAGVTSVPLSSETLRTLTRGFTADPSQQVLDTATLARAIGAAVGGYRQIGGALPLSFEQAATTVARSAGISPQSQRPFGGHTAAVGNFVSQAVGLNLTPQQAAQVVVEVRQNGGLSDTLRDTLRTGAQETGRAPGEVNKTLRALEAAARALPHGVVTGQVAPAAPPVVQPVAIRPEVNPGAVTAALEMDGTV